MTLPFDPDAFKLRYPQFSSYENQELIDIFDNEVIAVFGNILKFFIKTERQLYWGQIMLAHILTLQQGTLRGGTGITGIVNSASQGSVSSGWGSDISMGSMQWWQLTAYGQRVWVLIKMRGGATYVPGASTNSMTIAGIY
ncbi:MAG: protein of unknown function DUF4054 [Caudoviricetes sp.]|nr:MAG: protein of unknown function DUF4054 [Caudoviricetes sp.]